MTLEIVAVIPQVDGGTRYLLDTPRIARAMRAEIRRDRAMIEAMTPRVIVEEKEEGGRLWCTTWPSHLPSPPWEDIRDVLGR